MRQVWKQKQFYSNSKKNTGVSFASYGFPMGIYSIDLYNNVSQLVFFLTQYWCDMVYGFTLFEETTEEIKTFLIN